MDDQRNRDLKHLINSLRFLLTRQQFLLHQISAEQQSLLKSVDHLDNIHKKLEHVGHIRDFQLLLSENLRQLQLHHDKLQKFLDLNPDLNETELYLQAGGVLKETLTILK